MSKLLVEVQNFTDKWIRMGARVNNAALGLEKPLDKGKHPLKWNIPDNSDSSKHFNDNQINIQILDPPSGALLKEFTMWDDDWKNYAIYFCDGSDWKNTTRLMRGGDKGGNRDRVILHVAEHPKGNFELTAVVLTEDEVAKSVATAFKAFTHHPDIMLDPNKPYTPEDLKRFVAHPAFKSVMDAADGTTYKSVGLVIGAGGGLAVNVQAYWGLLFKLGGGDYSIMRTEAISLGLGGGVAAFAGVCLFSALPAGVAGFDFCAEGSLGMGPGIIVTVSVGLSGTHGLTIFESFGVDISLGLGVSLTQVTAL